MKRNGHRPAFREKIDEHYSLTRLNSFPIFRGGMGKRRPKKGMGESEFAGSE